MIDVSIDAYEEDTYRDIDKWRFRVNLKIVINLIKFKNEQMQTKIIVSFVEQHNNSSEINDFKISGQIKELMKF